MKLNKDIEVIAYLPEHAREILVRPGDLHVKQNEEFIKWTELNSKGGAFTGRRISDGKILACAGIRILWPGVGEAWAIFCDEVGSYAFEAYAYIATYALQIINDFNLKRIQCFVQADNALYVKYLENLGFRREGLLRKFGRNGEDHYIYAIILE